MRPSDVRLSSPPHVLEEVTGPSRGRYMSNSFTSISLMSFSEDSASITSLLWSCDELVGTGLPGEVTRGASRFTSPWQSRDSSVTRGQPGDRWCWGVRGAVAMVVTGQVELEVSTDRVVCGW